MGRTRVFLNPNFTVLRTSESSPLEEGCKHPRPLIAGSNFLMANHLGVAQGAKQRRAPLKQGHLHPLNMFLHLPLTRKLFIWVILRRYGSALYVERIKHGSSWQFHGTFFRALSTNLFLYWMLPPVSRVCFHYYFNFVLAERRCQIKPFKRNASFGGPLESLYFWLSVPQHIWGTYWFPQTILHAVLTLLLEGHKAHFLWGAVPPGSSEPALKGRSTVGKSIVSRIDATMEFTPGHALSVTSD